MLLPLALLASCQTIPTTGTDKAVCAIWTPVSYSALHDTPETIAGVRVLNARRDAYCKG